MKAFRLAAIVLCCSLCGCTATDRMLHDLKPHRLSRLNHHPKPGRADFALFSVADAAPAADARGKAAWEQDDQD